MKQLDEYTSNKIHLQIELMMENAGYHLARLVSKMVPTGSSVFVGYCWSYYSIHYMSYSNNIILKGAIFGMAAFIFAQIMMNDVSIATNGRQYDINYDRQHNGTHHLRNYSCPICKGTGIIPIHSKGKGLS